MIEKIYRNKYMVTCDNCGAGQEFDTWTDALEYMLEEGWKKKGDWEYYCPECQESEEMSEINDIFQVDYLPDERKIKINLPEEVWKKIDSIIMTRHFQKIKTIRVFHREE